MLHILLHFLVPILIALIFYRNRWGFASFLMIATMIIDADHLLADPIYDPLRCSINFHPLHSYVAIIFYGLLFLIPLALKGSSLSKVVLNRLDLIHLLGLGLIIHMILDALDCL